MLPGTIKRHYHKSPQLFTQAVPIHHSHSPYQFINNQNATCTGFHAKRATLGGTLASISI